MTNKEFTNLYGNAARAACKGSGIFPETCLAQAALESNGGKSELAVKHFNFFGIKDSTGDEWHGAKVLMNTREVVNGKSIYVDRYFRKYQSAQESFADYVNFLKKNPRYTKAGVFTAPDFNVQIERIAAAGYATGLNYAATVKQIAANVTKALEKLAAQISDEITDPKNTGLIILVCVVLVGGVLYLNYTS